jgi:secreted trypsin-like serine protease
MKRLALTLALAVTLALAGPASAVLYGAPDGDDHPMVGLAVFDVDGVPAWRCSGTLLSPTVFLTAGHCASGTSGARVWFESVVDDQFYPFSGGTAIDGTPHAHPLYDDFASFPATFDIGVVVLDEPVTLSEYGSLPSVNQLGSRKSGGQQKLTIVGYGLQGVVPLFSADRERYQGTVKITNLTSAYTDGYNIHVSSNPGVPHSGGACFGDSGGPAFLGSGLTIVGVASFVLNQNCVGSGFYVRTDVAEAHEWVSGFLD